MRSTGLISHSSHAVGRRVARSRYSKNQSGGPLRNQEPPYDVVAVDLDKIRKAVLEALDSFPQENREKLHAVIVNDYLQAQRNKL
jgi:hypothetical protein